MTAFEDIIVSPIITEKSTLAKMDSMYVFAVKANSTKIDIRNAVEGLFKVKVVAVNTAKIGGKTRKMGKSTGFTGDWKKAYVKLQSGQKIELIEGML